jgi:hypothetical protein
MSTTLDFENVFLGGQKADQGRFKISNVGMGFKSTTGEIITVAPNDIKGLEFLTVARDCIMD